MSMAHIPVLLGPVIEHLAPQDGELFIDGTFGAGGYSSAILDAANVRILAFDRDLSVVRAAAAACDRYPNRLRVINATFSEMERFARIEETPNSAPLIEGPFVDGIVLDLGVSSMQIDQPERGFSFQNDGPLDMRMSQEGDCAGRSAADLVNTLDEEAIANILFTYGDERKSRAIARAIVKRRAVEPFSRTLDLASVIARVLGPRKADGKHQATRSFQALRIAVNDELGELSRALIAAERLLKPGGRLVIVTFHSLEDRLVKRFLIERAGKQSAGSRYMPEIIAAAPPSFQIVNQRPVSPSDEECAANPRARSSKLRAAIRTEAAPWPQGTSTEPPTLAF